MALAASKLRENIHEFLDRVLKASLEPTDADGDSRERAGAAGHGNGTASVEWPSGAAEERGVNRDRDPVGRDHAAVSIAGRARGRTGIAAIGPGALAGGAVP
jgi:hypothetical protein